MKRHNVCKRQVAIDTGVRKKNAPCYFNGIKITTVFKCIFEETMQKLLLNFDSHNKKYPGAVSNFGFTAPQYSDKY